jgi:hypothetical protein
LHQFVEYLPAPAAAHDAVGNDVAGFLRVESFVGEEEARARALWD